MKLWNQLLYLPLLWGFFFFFFYFFFFVYFKWKLKKQNQLRSDMVSGYLCDWVFRCSIHHLYSEEQVQLVMQFFGNFFWQFFVKNNLITYVSSSKNIFQGQFKMETLFVCSLVIIFINKSVYYFIKMKLNWQIQLRGRNAKSYIEDFFVLHRSNLKDTRESY